MSAHWETRDGRTHLTAGKAPRTIHDFGGFPDELFAMQYPAPGSPDLVERVAALLGQDKVVRDESWGFDHGSWCVLQPMFPACDIPTVQIGIDRTIGAAGVLEIGRKLAPLRDEGVLLVGSGNIVHNLAEWRNARGREPEWALEFGTRIRQAIIDEDTTALTAFGPDDRAAALAVNSGEHYLPLLFTIGARLPGDDLGFFNETVDWALSMTSVLLGDTSLLGGIA
jgi:4,5-DOPA dioxygenase extradiol